VAWALEFTREAVKDARRLKRANLETKTKKMLVELKADPFAPTHRLEKLVGDLQGCYSKRINIQHRLVYTVFPKEKIVRVLRMWNHYV
jgi:Txe/YoeB family toxin of toxin-antitoxin system